MKKMFALALATVGFTVTPSAALAGDDTEHRGISYTDAMDCSAVFALLSSKSEGRISAAHGERAARWLVIAMRRDGTTDGSRADAALIPLIEELIETLEQAPTPSAREKFTDDMVDFCDAKEELIEEEFYGISV